MEAILWHDFVLNFLYEEEKIPLLTSCSSLYIGFHDELLAIRADYHSLREYQLDNLLAFYDTGNDWDEAQYQALIEDLRSESSGRSS